MWRKLLRILGFLIGCGVVCAYILYASHLAQLHRSQQRVSQVVVSIADSAETRQFATSLQIAAQLKRRDLNAEGKLVDSVDAVKIADYIAGNGFVSDADVYVTYGGKMYVDVKQHRPIVRLLCGGFNSYITREGDAFRSPRGAAYYTAVVTGAYKPLFVPKGDGDVESGYLSLVAKEDERLGRLVKEFTTLQSDYSSCENSRSKLRKDRRRKPFESRSSHEQRKVAIDIELANCDKELQQLDKRMVQLEKRQRNIEMRKKKLQKRYEDFRNLVTFVDEVSSDSFWGAEVVQFIADTTSTGEISLQLVPRSGDFTIILGTLAERDAKMRKLQKFYDKGLSHLGWDRYKSVDLRYSKQVICAE